MRSQTIMINGKTINVPRGLKTSDLAKTINLDDDHFIAEQNEIGQFSQILERNSILPKKSNLNLMTLPRYIQGYDSKASRIHDEISIISYRFPVQFDEYNLDYISIKKFPLNHKFNYLDTTLLIKIPVQYPFSPPEHFYLKKGLLYKGASPEHYFQDAGFNDLDSLGWSKYCLHVKSWKPNSDIISGDSLITFLELIKLVFDNIERERV